MRQQVPSIGQAVWSRARRRGLLGSWSQVSAGPPVIRLTWFCQPSPCSSRVLWRRPPRGHLEHVSQGVKIAETGRPFVSFPDWSPHQRGGGCEHPANAVWHPTSMQLYAASSREPRGAARWSRTLPRKVRLSCISAETCTLIPDSRVMKQLPPSESQVSVDRGTPMS